MGAELTREGDREGLPSGGRVHIDLSAQHPEVFKLPGSTTGCRDAADELAARYGIVDTGCPWVGEATLVSEPENPVDAHAVALFVEGQRVAYLPSFIAHLLDSRGAEEIGTIPVQVWSRTIRDEQRTYIWGYFGSSDRPRWDYTEKKPPPFTRAEVERARGAARAAVLNERTKSDRPGVQEELAAGTVRGIHYSQTPDLAQSLRREGRYEEALEVALVGLEGMEGRVRHALDTGTRPLLMSHYHQQVLVAARKLRRRDVEIDVLCRFCNSYEAVHGRPPGSEVKYVQQLARILGVDIPEAINRARITRGGQ